MSAYLLQRLLLLIPTLIGVSMIVYVSVRLVPGDIVDELTAEGQLTAEQKQTLRDAYSLDQGVVSGYLEWMGGLLRGDLGSSFRANRDISDDLFRRLPPTIEMAIAAVVVALLIGIPIGVVSAVSQETAVDHLARSFAVLLVAVPSFWLALLSITYGFLWFGWAPPLRYAELWDDPLANFKILVTPGIILGAGISGAMMRLTRSAMLEVLRQDYVRTARAKGLNGKTVIFRHALRNGMIPIVTLLGIQLPALIGGTVALETIFSVPGMGTYLIDALQHRDYPIIQAVVMVTAVFVLLVNLIVDMSYSVIDPRIRLAR